MGNSSTHNKDKQQEESRKQKKFPRFYIHSQIICKQWRNSFHTQLNQNAIRDLWTIPQGLEIQNCSLNDFVPIDTKRRLPHGHFGMFPVVKLKQNSKIYRMKIHSRKLLNESHIPKRYDKVLTELKILANADFPFILKLRGYFIDYMNFYVVTEDYICGDLNAALQRSSITNPGLREAKILSNREACFIAAQIIFGLYYLHSINVMHRDLKTENILLRLDGYIVLCDFGFSKVMDKSFRAYSRLGTWEYMAPEVLRGQSYTYSADFWGFGCIVHQLVAGCPPFKKLGASTEAGCHFAYRNLVAYSPIVHGNQLPINSQPATKQQHQQQQRNTPLQQILDQQQQQIISRWDHYTWDPFNKNHFERATQVSALLADLLDHVFKEDPHRRIGSNLLIEQNPAKAGTGALKIMSHIWFKDIDFELLQQRNLPAPWKPPYADYSQCADSSWDVFDIATHLDPNCSDRIPPLRSHTSKNQ